MDDRFRSPAPTFQPTNNPTAIETTTPRPKDTTPSPSVVERLQRDGHDHLATLLMDAQRAAKHYAPPVDEEVSRLRRVREPTIRVPVSTTPTVQIQPGDVVDDMTFIRRTRDGNFHTPEMHALFYANGGQKYMVGDLSYAAAFDAMRRDIMRRLRNKR